MALYIWVAGKKGRLPSTGSIVQRWERTERRKSRKQHPEMEKTDREEKE